MKKSILLLTWIIIAHASAKAFSQPVSLDCKNSPLSSIFKEIERQTKFEFIYPSKELYSRRISISVSNAKIEEVMKMCLRGLPFSYYINGNRIVVTKDEFSDSINFSDTLKEVAPPSELTGRVTNEKGEPVAGATISIKGTDISTASGGDGYFTIKGVNSKAFLIVSSVGYQPKLVRLTGENKINIRMIISADQMKEVEVINTGYQKAPKERITGSFDYISKEELNRRVGTDILSRLEGLTTGMQIDKRTLQPNQNTINASNILIRGLSTMTPSIQRPLIILNNFPYEGDINNINPNDVDNITILKDAAAASIWGARAGNGVIVITTKSGKYNQNTKVSVSSTTNIISKPDLFHYKRMSIEDYVNLETMLFNNGFYDGTINNNVQYQALSPVVEILNNRRSGTISPGDSANQLNSIKRNDFRNDFTKYIYRTSINQQYYLNVSGGGNKYRYSISGGFDKNPNLLIGNQTERISLRADNKFIISNKLEAGIGISFTSSNTTDNALGDFGSSEFDYYSGIRLYPYASFKDANGANAAMPKKYRVGYVDTAGNGKLLDWHYNPLNEISNNDRKSTLQDVLLNLDLSYRIIPNLSLSLNYQYEHGNGKGRRYRNISNFETRDLINLFSQISSSGSIANKIPIGGILDEQFSEFTSQSTRAQVNYAFVSKDRKHEISFLSGLEVRENKSEASIRRIYGLDELNYSFTNIDYITQFPQYGDRGFATIPNGDAINKYLDRFVSFYGNASYTYDSRYVLSASARRDASNIFGVKSNNKWKPLWSIGASWNLSNEYFLNLPAFVNNIRLRGSYGFQGNTNNSLSPFTTIDIQSANTSIINRPYSNIVKPTDPSLSWETIKSYNVGTDINLFNNRIGITAELYKKSSNNLILGAITDPTTGILAVAKNSASIRTTGVEIKLTTINIKTQKFHWRTDFLFSKTKDKIVDFSGKNPQNLGAIPMSNGATIIGIKGNPAYGIYSLPSPGLDPANGDPQGYLGKEVSKNYLAILNQKLDTSNIILHGSAIPTIFGNVNNTFTFKGVSLTMSLSYKFNYYFRKNSMNYYSLFYNGITHRDYENRWKQKGDETLTTIPSLVYPIADSYRDNFYAATSYNVLKGDHVRLDLIKLGYDLPQKLINSFARSVRISGTISNLGIIWRKNNEGLDPDFDTGNAAFPQSKSYAISINVDF